MSSSIKSIKSIKSILVVEDDVISQKLMTFFLNKKGFEPFVVDNGEAAIHVCRESDFDLIFMDISMPVMDGFTATKQIREYEERHERHTPIIAMTAFLLADEKEKCIEYGLDDYISKPINLNEVIQVIHKWESELISNELIT